MTAPPVLAAAIIPSHSARDDAIGFSTRTWTPARAPAIVGGAWQGWGGRQPSGRTGGGARVGGGWQGWGGRPRRPGARARSTISATSVKALTPYRSAKAPR